MMMQQPRNFLLFIFLLLLIRLPAQPPSPWESVAPAGSFVYTDLRSAEKEAANCYRLELSGVEFLKDKKMLGRIAQLSGVMALRMENNNLTQLPSAFLAMHGLMYFHSSGNPFTSLSDSLGMWSELHFLELSGTNFDTLPEGIYGCTKLQSLSIASNKDTMRITGGISSLRNTLTELKIYSTLLDTLPAELASMNKLHKLVLYKSGLNEIPAPVCSLGQLQELWLDSNSISKVPRSISLMKGLTYLSLRGNKIKHVTSSICFLQNLAVLDLSGNPIDPYEIKCLQALLPSCRIIF